MGTLLNDTSRQVVKHGSLIILIIIIKIRLFLKTNVSIQIIIIIILLLSRSRKTQAKAIPQASGGVAEWLRRSVSNLVGPTRVGANSVADTTSHKPTANSAVHPSLAPRLVNEYSGATLRAQAIVP